MTASAGVLDCRSIEFYKIDPPVCLPPFLILVISYRSGIPEPSGNQPRPVHPLAASHVLTASAR